MLEVAMSDQNLNLLRFQIFSRKRHIKSGEKCAFWIKICLKTAQIIPTLFCRAINSKLAGKTLILISGYGSKGWQKVSTEMTHPFLSDFGN